MDGFSSDQWNNIDGMVSFILFDGTEQSCWAYLCTFQPRAQYGRLPKLRETVDKFMIRVRRWLLYCHLLIAYLLGLPCQVACILKGYVLCILRVLYF